MQDREYYRQRKALERVERTNRWRMIIGVAEFFGVVAGVVCILLMLALLFSLVNWLRFDISNTFAILKSRF